VSISSTLNARIFRTNVGFGSFFLVTCMLPKRHSYEKLVRLMLMKLTQEEYVETYLYLCCDKQYFLWKNVTKLERQNRSFIFNPLTSSFDDGRKILLEISNSLSLSLTHTHTHTHIAHAPTSTHTHTLFLAHAPYPSLFLSHTHLHSIALAHTAHTHTHTQ